MSVDFVSMERRLQRDGDSSNLETLRVVQQTHAEMLLKLTDAANSNATTLALHAQTLVNLSETQKIHAKTMEEHNLAINSNVVEHAALRAAVRTILWGVPLIITITAVIVNVTAYVVPRLAR